MFINVSSSEGLPVSIMESSSCGLPTIATDVGGTGEIVSDGVNGRLISANPMPREIAAAVEEFARMDSDAFDRWSAAARETWATHFDSDRNYRQFVAKMLLQIHDELVFETPPEELDGLLAKLNRFRDEAGTADSDDYQIHVISLDAYTVDGIKRLEDKGVTDVIVGFRLPYQVGPDTEPLQPKIDHLRRYADSVISTF